MNIEKEIKIVLTEDEYHVVNTIFKWDNEYEQINHYYGSSDDIRMKTNTYRVREKEGKVKLQLKIPEKYEGSLHIKNEYEKEILVIPDVLRKEELEEMTGLLFLEDKSYIGKLVTWRKQCLQYKGIEICLDKNEYLNKIDYEIEIEYKDDYPRGVIDILESYGIKTDAFVEGKNKRYLKEMIRVRELKENGT